MRIYTFLINNKFFDAIFAESFTAAREKLRIIYNTENVRRVG